MPEIIQFPKDKLRGYSITAKAKEADIWIYDPIGIQYGGLTAGQFVEDIKELGDVETITVHFNSPGGDFFDGITMYNMLKQHKARIVVSIDGLAASAASVVAMAGDEINIAENAMMMIHEARTPAFGTAAELRKKADLTDRANASCIKSYMTRVKIDEDQVVALMVAETWMDAEESIEYGFADQLTESLEIAACADLEKFKFKNIPQAFTESETPPDPKVGGNSNDEPATPKPAEVVEPPEPKLQADPPAAVPLTEESRLHPRNFESRDKKRIDTSYGELKGRSAPQ